MEMNAAHYMETLFEGMPQAVLFVNASYEVATVNGAAEELGGASRERLSGVKLYDSPFKSVIPLIERACQQETSVVEYGHRLGTPRFSGEVRAVVMVAGEDEKSGFICQLEPMERLQAISAREAQSDSLRASRLMAAMLAHEIKNPLAGIRGAAQLLTLPGEVDVERMGTLICNEVERIRTMVDRLEFLTDSPMEEEAAVNVHEAIRHVTALAGAGWASHAVIAEQFDPSLPEILTRRNILIQILMNLVKNAGEVLKGCKEPKISVSTSYVSSTLAVSTEQGGNTTQALAIEIADNGPGMPHAILKRWSDPFVTTRNRGRGLGLTIAAKYASDLGGRLDLVRSDERGTLFRLLLPLKTVGAEKQQTNSLQEVAA